MLMATLTTKIQGAALYDAYYVVVTPLLSKETHE